MLFPECKIERAAIFSKDEQYRYTLTRVWNRNLPLLGMVLLNPSTATAEEDDPTIHRQSVRARHLGFGGLIVTNIFAWRSTDPDKIYRVPDPIGPDNDRYIKEAMFGCKQVVCGWGQHGAHMGRGYLVARMLQTWGVPTFALHINDDGSPAHPLYLPYTAPLLSYQPQECLV